MLIVEGPDGAGKTTLIAGLAEKFDLPIAPRVVSKDAQAMINLKQWVEHNVSTAPHPKIFDRHRLISEPIYGPILRHSQEPGFSDPLWMMQQMRAFYRSNPLIIYCLPPLPVVMDNVLQGEDNRVVWDHIRQIYTAYCARAAIDYTRSPNSVRIYDYTTDGQETDPLAVLNDWARVIEGWKNL